MKTLSLCAAVLAVGVFAALLAFSFGGAAAAIGVSVDDLLGGGVEPGKRVRITAQVREIVEPFKPKVLMVSAIPPEGSEVDPNARLIKIVYDGDDDIQVDEYSHVSAEGTWDPEKGFTAEKLSTKCPTKYENEETPMPAGATVSK